MNKNEVVLSEFKLNILKKLFIYRATSALQLTKLIYKKQTTTVSNQKFIYRELSKLVKDGYVKMYKPQPGIYRYSLYYLTRSGLEFMLNEFDIVEGHHGNGWISANSYSYGWFDYEVYSPPLEQILHHTMLIDFFINISVDVPTSIEHRNNLYAKRKTPGNQNLRIDAEVRMGNKYIAIEIDRGTESHSQLIDKFKSYLIYLKDLETRDIELDLKDIVFIVDNIKQREGGLKRRWLNIMSAFYKAMNEYAFKVDLHLCTLEDAYDTLHYELEHKDAFTALATHIHKKNHVMKRLHFEPNSHKGFVMQDEHGDYYFSVINQEYSTAVIRLFNHFKQFNLDCKDYFVGCIGDLPRFNYDLTRYEVPDKAQSLFKELNELITDTSKISMPRTKIDYPNITLNLDEYDIYNF